MEIKDGKTGSPEAKPHGSPGRKKEIREIKKPFREPAWGQPEEPGGGTKDSGIKNGVPGASRSTGTPTLNAAACYSPTPSRVQYHRRDQALASGFGKGPGVSPGP